MMKHVLSILSVALLLVHTGCTVDSTDSSSAETQVVSQATGSDTETPAKSASTPEPTSTPAQPISTDGRDQLNISGAILLGPHAGVPIKSASITRNLYAASIEGGLVNFSVDRLNWPVPNTPVAGVDARTYIFWQEGSQVYGGHFDWQRPGQTSKTLNNVYAGYLGRRPPKGAPVWFALCRIDGRERTNVAISQNPWP